MDFNFFYGNPPIPSLVRRRRAEGRGVMHESILPGWIVYADPFKSYDISDTVRVVRHNSNEKTEQKTWFIRSSSSLIPKKMR